MPTPRIIAQGTSTYEKDAKRDVLAHLTEAAHRCLHRAGFPKERLDGLTLASFGYPPGNVATLAEYLGLSLRWAEHGAFGGASGVIGVARAHDAIRLGQAEAVLCMAGDSFTVRSHDSVVGAFTPTVRDYLAPHGFGGANGLFALVQTRHSALYGTRPEDLGRLAVTQRQHALLHDNALFTTSFTLEDYLTARVIASPLRLYDCVMPCAGAHGVLIVDADVFDISGRPAVELLSHGEAHNAYPDLASSVNVGCDKFASAMFKAAGVSRADLDLVELYDDYPIMVAIQLEGYGLCDVGRGGPFLATTDLGIDGDIPINTNGGQLSCGQAGAGGGLLGMAEAVTQLQGEAGERQVPDATVALVSGFGLISYGKGLSIAGALLRRAD